MGLPKPCGVRQDLSVTYHMSAMGGVIRQLDTEHTNSGCAVTQDLAPFLTHPDGFFIQDHTCLISQPSPASPHLRFRTLRFRTLTTNRRRNQPPFRRRGYGPKYHSAEFSGREDRFLIHLHHDDGGLHTHILETQSGRLLPVPGKLHVTKIAPNGTWGVVLPTGLELRFAHLESGEIRTVCGLHAGWSPARWSANDGEIFVFEPAKDYATGNIIRINVHTGEQSPWLTLHPADAVWNFSPAVLDITPDGRSYAYTYQQDLGDLYILDGLI